MCCTKCWSCVYHFFTMAIDHLAKLDRFCIWYNHTCTNFMFAQVIHKIIKIFEQRGKRYQPPGLPPTVDHPMGCIFRFNTLNYLVSFLIPSYVHSEPSFLKYFLKCFLNSIFDQLNHLNMNTWGKTREIEENLNLRFLLIKPRPNPDNSTFQKQVQWEYASW